MSALVIRDISSDLQLSACESVVYGMRYSRLSTLVTENAGIGGYSITGSSLPSPSRIKSWMAENINPLTAQRIIQSPAFSNLNTKVVFTKVRARVITPEMFVSMWLNDDGEMLYALLHDFFEDSRRVSTVSDSIEGLLDSEWNLAKPLGIDELTLIRDRFVKSFDWSRLRLGELSFAARRSRSLFGVTGDPWDDQMFVANRMSKIEQWRSSALEYQALAWSSLKFNGWQSYNSNDITKAQLALARNYSFDDVAPFVMAGIDNPSAISAYIREGVDVDTARAFVGC